MKKNYRKLIKNNLEFKKETKYLSNGKNITTHLIAGLIKKTL